MSILILCRYLQLAVLNVQPFHTLLTLSYFTFWFTGWINTEFWVLQKVQHKFWQRHLDKYKTGIW